MVRKIKVSMNSANHQLGRSPFQMQCQARAMIIDQISIFFVTWCRRSNSRYLLEQRWRPAMCTLKTINRSPPLSIVCQSGTDKGNDLHNQKSVFSLGLPFLCTEHCEKQRNVLWEFLTKVDDITTTNGSGTFSRKNQWRCHYYSMESSGRKCRQRAQAFPPPV